jgi:hypothetical protein
MILPHSSVRLNDMCSFNSMAAGMVGFPEIEAAVIVNDFQSSS